VQQLQIAEADSAAFFEEEAKDWASRYRSRTYDERKTLIVDFMRTELDLHNARQQDAGERCINYLYSKIEKPYCATLNSESIATPRSLVDSPASDNTAPDCYLGIQNRQFTLREFRQALRGCGMGEEQHRFTVAPSLLKKLESSPFIGMMLFSLSRKENSSSKPIPDFPV
jgi:hypothetical protein